MQGCVGASKANPGRPGWGSLLGMCSNVPGPAASSSPHALHICTHTHFIPPRPTPTHPTAPADYANPAAYFLQALVVNEFESPSWDTPVAERNPDATPGMTEGEFYMRER